jgi:hypothetical protein
VETDKRQSAFNTIHAVEDVPEQNPPVQDYNVAAFRPQQQQSRSQPSGYNNRGNQPRGQGSFKGNLGNRQNQTQGSNASRNGKFCVYCNIMNHTQDECRKRMKDNKPCVNSIGQLYWPKINNIETNMAESQNFDPNNGVGLVFQSRAS